MPRQKNSHALGAPVSQNAGTAAFREIVAGGERDALLALSQIREEVGDYRVRLTYRLALVKRGLAEYQSLYRGKVDRALVQRAESVIRDLRAKLPPERKKPVFAFSVEESATLPEAA